MSLTSSPAPPPALPAAGPTPWPLTTRLWLAALLGWTCVIAFYDLGGGARFEPIDCWVAQTAREMLEANDWLVPRFSGETRMQKSPGPYWAVMAVSVLRGTPVDEVSARIPNAFAAILIVGTIFWLARHVAGERAAVFAGFSAASSALILWWSHRAASDIGLTAWTTLSLASLWVAAESEPRPGRRNALFLLGYFAAGMGMLWKMPMPLVVVGLPVFVYLLIRWRWRVLAHPIHLLGLLIFLLPWLPWAIAVTQVEPAAILKWKVEYLDRFTGEMPNVEDQNKLIYRFVYLLPPLLYCLPYSLSLPGAFVRAFNPSPGMRRDGLLFVFIWFASLLVFFTASAGKEDRYLLPALPPLFILLGIELAAFFNPATHRVTRDTWVWVWAIWVGLPAALAAAILVGLRKWWQLRGQYELAGLYDWTDVALSFGMAAAIIAIGAGLAAWWYARGQRNIAFGTLVIMMWVLWLYAWPNVMPKMLSQRPFIDFASQLADPQRVPPSARQYLRQIGSQDSRIIWYSNIRFPRLLDQLELLERQKGQRSLQWEKEAFATEMVERLAATEPILLVATLTDYVEFMNAVPPELAKRGRPLPPLHLWLQARYGTEDRHFVLLGNRPPRYAEPTLELRPALREKLLGKGRILAWPPASQPASRPASQPGG